MHQSYDSESVCQNTKSGEAESKKVLGFEDIVEPLLIHLCVR